MSNAFVKGMKDWRKQFEIKQGINSEYVYEKLCSLTDHQGKTNEKHTVLSSPSDRMAIIKKTKVRNSGVDVEKEELLYTFGWNAFRHCRKQYGH